MRGRKPDGKRDEAGGVENSGVHGNDFQGPAAVQEGTTNEQQFGDRYYNTTYHIHPVALPPGDTAPGPPPADPWVSLAERAAAWRHVEPGADHEALKQQAMTAALALARARDEARQGLDRDVWYEPRLAERIAYRVDWLFDNLWNDGQHSVELSPAESALLSLLPMFHHTRTVLRAARHLPVEPERLTPGEPQAGGARVPYERFLRTYGRLVRRANHLAGIDDAGRRDIAWWLYHRWLATDPELARDTWPVDLLAAAGISRAPAGPGPGPGPGTVLADVVDAAVLRRLLSAPYVSPHELCGIDGQPFLHGQRWTVVGEERKEQRVREQFVGVVFAVAHALAIEATELPPVIVQHIGTPEPGAVRLGALHRTLADTRWDQRANGKERQLRARCQHNAVAAALREHARTLDGLLRAVHRAGEHGSWPAELHELPVFVGDDGVVEVDAEGSELPPRAAVAFRFDEAAVQELLVGERLYRNPALAIRELYQNALDACRYRRARERAHAQRLGRRADSAGYEGEIAFTHGFTADGRPYLRCRDNGVGMGEEELTGVFSEAGARFVESAAYLAEQAEWAELPEPVSVQPNSRFGIGVLSYFMLADEIEVSTCRLHKDGTPGRRLTVRITGPGQFFQVMEDDGGDSGDPCVGPGTTVTLYPRDDTADQSAADTLQALLGYTEFRTTATRADGTGEVWEPDVMTPRARPSWEESGIDAHGRVVRWEGEVEHEGATLRGQVMWCEYGGGLLVDGLHAVSAEKHGGVLHTRGYGISGALVNLDGGWGVALSVDRAQILEDVSAVVLKLLDAATAALVRPSSELLTFRWLCAVASRTPVLADIVSAAADAVGVPLSFHRDQVNVPAVPGGCFPPDVGLAGQHALIAFHNVNDMHFVHDVTDTRGFALDHVVLWRALARGRSTDLARLALLVPEVADVGEVLTAHPTDAYVLRFLGEIWADDDEWDVRPCGLLQSALRVGMTPRRFALRAAELGLAVRADRFPDEFPPDPLDFAVLTSGLDGVSGSLDTQFTVPVAHLLDAQSRRGISLSDARRRLTAYGFAVPDLDGLPDRLSTSDAVLLSRSLSGQAPWIATGPVPPGHVAAAALALGVTPGEVRARLELFGLSAHPWRSERTVEAVDVEVLKVWAAVKHFWLDPAKPVPPGRVLEAAMQSGREPAELAEMLHDVGYDLPPVLPASQGSEQRDRRLLMLSHNGDGVGPWLNAHKPLPALHARMFARTVGLPASEVIDYLTDMGFTLVGDAASKAGDLELLTFGLGTLYDFDVGDADEVVPLALLLEAARQTGRDIADIARRFRELGLNVKGPAEQIRAALARVPLQRPT